VTHERKQLSPNGSVLRVFIRLAQGYDAFERAKGAVTIDSSSSAVCFGSAPRVAPP